MRLISQIDDKDTETMEKVYLFLTGIVRNKQKPKRELTPEQARKVALVDKYCGAFAERQSRKEPRQLSQVIENLGNINLAEFSAEQLEEDPRLAYLLEREEE